MTDARTIHRPHPVLSGFGLTLRAWELGDADAMLAGVTDPELLRWNTPRIPVTDLEGVRAVLEARAAAWDRGDMVMFAVAEEGTGLVVGHVGLHAINPSMRCAGVGYWTLPDHRGRGIARRALEVCTRWGFEETGRGGLGLHRVELGHALGHEASCLVAERAGYRYEGTRRGGMHEAHDLTAFRDAHGHARLASDPYPAP
ncbi:GNAT family N-acetyltransferase [Streptomyces sp. NPDC050738]|uniref:GNAT family N-acetyltransferase n=1 Tax=Streptomyces sp. NPDC050738 TaxID=3154744 RepID=UPI003449E639